MSGLLPALALGAGFLLVFAAILWGLKASGKHPRRKNKAEQDGADAAWDAVLSIVLADDADGHDGDGGHGGGGDGGHGGHH